MYGTTALGVRTARTIFVVHCCKLGQKPRVRSTLTGAYMHF